MGDHQKQKIHPVVLDVEAAGASTQTVPLMPRGSATSEKQGIRSYSQTQPPATVLERTIPAMHINSLPKNSRSCCCQCICWTISILILLLVTIGAAAGILYLVFQPKLPKYSVDQIRISDLQFNYDLTVYARFDVKITAENPNEKIGIHYEEGGRLSVLYEKTKLCEGSLPRFYQGHKNITKLDVALTGKTQFASTLMNALQEQQQTGRIPLDLKVDAPVAIELGTLKLRKVRILGDCLLVVDNLAANRRISIKASDCNFNLKL